MNVLSLTSAFLALSIPATASGGEASATAIAAPKVRVVRPSDALSTGASAALARLKAAATRPFRAHVSPENGAAQNLVGGELAAAKASVEASALAFLADHGGVFGLPAGLETTTEVRGATPTRVYVRFSKNGVPIEGIAAVVELDSLGRIVAAHVRGGHGSTELGAFAIERPAAEGVAVAELARHRQRLGRVAAFAGEAPRAWRVWLATAGGIRPAYRVEFASKRQGEAYSCYVDASTAGVLRTVERAHSGTGAYPFFGDVVEFTTGKATCSNYKSMDAAIAAKSSKGTTKDWSLGIGAPVNLAKGFMTGARFDVFDDNGSDPFAANGKFVFDPLTQPDAFDVSNTGFEINAAYAHLKKNLGHELASNFAMPLVVNVKDTTLNAFFTSSAFPDGHTDGFMVFFDNTQLGSVEADFSRDPSVVDHEYTHAWTHFEGESFEDPLDYPTRAANEAIADFFALAKQKDFVLGRYLEHIYQGLGIARDLQDDDHLVPVFAEAITLTQSGLPEEHRMGEVLGSFMTDLRVKLGTKKSMRIVYDALPFIPNDMAGVGFVTVDANNAFDAVTAFFGSFAAGLLEADLATGGKNQGAIHGAAAARGVTNNLSAGTAQLIDLPTFSKGKIKIPSRFVVDGDQHVYAFTGPLNAHLKLTIEGKSGVLPEVSLLNGIWIDTTMSISGGGKKTVVNATLADAGDVYVIQIDNGGTVGTYTLTLDI